MLFILGFGRHDISLYSIHPLKWTWERGLTHASINKVLYRVARMSSSEGRFFKMIFVAESPELLQAMTTIT